MELHQRVLTERRRHRLEPRDQRELHAQHRHSDEPERNGEFRPESATRRRYADHGEDQGARATAMSSPNHPSP